MRERWRAEPACGGMGREKEKDIHTGRKGSDMATERCRDRKQRQTDIERQGREREETE